MEARAGSPAPPGAPLGAFDVTLLIDPGGTTYSTTIQMRATNERIAREAVLVIGVLLFAQRIMRSVSDPSRLAAVAELDEVTVASRQGRLASRTPAANARTAATYRVDLLANGSFRIDVEQKVEGILSDVAGRLAAGALAAELLTSLSEPYRIFFREMVEAAVNLWRDRRPSPIEPTWDWPVALKRLDQLLHAGTGGSAEPQRCAACGALRPADYACLHCGAAPGASATTPAPATATPPPNPASSPPAVSRAATSSPPAPVAPASSQTAAAATATAEPPVERTILPAQEHPVGVVEEKPDERSFWPLASLPRRLGAFVLDLVSGAILAVIGAAGLTAILAASGAFGPDDSPSAFASLVWFIVFSLYLGLGWYRGETLGMVVFRLRILRAGDRRPISLYRAFLRGLGSLLLLALAFGVFAALMYVDVAWLPWLQGTPDLVFRIIILLFSLYILWAGSGQQILGSAGRQTLGDKIADTVVAVRKP